MKNDDRDETSFNCWVRHVVCFIGLSKNTVSDICSSSGTLSLLA